MAQIIIILITGFLLVGCSTQMAPSKHKHVHMPQMFQTVSADKATLVQDGEMKNSCVKCGMNLVKFYKTSHAASDNSTKYQYCSIHCLVEHLDEGNELKNPRVVDVSSLELIPVLEAHYVVGSKVRGTMSRVSKYAFKSLEDAQEFQKKNGGKILDFEGALEVSREDFN